MKPSRGWAVWAGLALSAAMVIGAMGWLTRSVLAAERDRAGAEARADLEERTRLALWRMDAEGAAVLLAENSLPPGRFAAGVLANAPDPLVHLHFETMPGGGLRSPETEHGFPFGDGGIPAKFAALRSLLNEHPLPLEGGELFRCAVEAGEASWQALPKEAPIERSRNVTLRQEKGSAQARLDTSYQTNINEAEFAQRVKVVEQTVTNRVAGMELLPAAAADDGIAAVGAMRAVWIGKELFLLRQLTLDHGLMRIQGAWLDAEVLRQRLLAEVTDLLPASDLVALASGTGPSGSSAEDPLALVSFPFRLERNEAPVLATGGFGGPLMIGWIAVACALAAVALLVAGILRLSERRASFVSAVTHELRTPLTTFQLYSEMLESGAVREERRGEYFSILRREAVRLSHLVENVLAFSGIERGSARSAPGAHEAGELIERMIDRFRGRLEETGLTLVADLRRPEWRVPILADPAALEHVLFNLIDNAAKYAAGSRPAEVRLDAREDRRCLTITVRDHGPGISGAERKRIFQAFHKSAAAAAETRPGVGLGLALSRRLARAGGGALVLDDADGGGACFALSLPKPRRGSAAEARNPDAADSN